MLCILLDSYPESHLQKSFDLSHLYIVNQQSAQLGAFLHFFSEQLPSLPQIFQLKCLLAVRSGFCPSSFVNFLVDQHETNGLIEILNGTPEKLNGVCLQLAQRPCLVDKLLQRQNKILLSRLVPHLEPAKIEEILGQVQKIDGAGDRMSVLLAVALSANCPLLNREEILQLIIDSQRKLGDESATASLVAAAIAMSAGREALIHIFEGFDKAFFVQNNQQIQDVSKATLILRKLCLDIASLLQIDAMQSMFSKQQKKKVAEIYSYVRGLFEK